MVGIDRLAADAKTAIYRTGTIDPVILEIPNNLQMDAIHKPDTGLESLVNYLVKDSANDFVKVKRIHDWITENIAYDSDLLLGLSDEGSKKVNGLLPLQRSTCGGFAGLFKKMADIAGLESETITGNSKTCWIKKSERDCHHVWNGVKIDGQWYMVDTTADGRYTFKNGKFTPKKSYKDVFLFIHPSSKRLINLPLEERQQYTRPFLSKTEFMSIPRVTVSYDQYEIRYTNETRQKFKEEKKDFEGGALQKIHDSAYEKNEIFEIQFAAPENILFFPQIVFDPLENFDDAQDIEKQLTKDDDNSSESDMNSRSFCYREEINLVTCKYTAPKAGRYKAYIQAREAGDIRKFKLIHAFTLYFEKSGPTLPLEKDKIYSNALFHLQKFKIITSEFRDPSEISWIEMEKPEENFVTSFVYGMDGKRVPGAVEYSYLSKEKIRFYYLLPNPGNYTAKILTRIPNQSGGSMMATSHIRLEKKSATKLLFPPPNQWVFTKLFSEKRLIGEVDLSSLKIFGITKQAFTCNAYGSDGKVIANQCRLNIVGDALEISFDKTNSALTMIKVFLKENNKSNLIAYLKFVLK